GKVCELINDAFGLQVTRSAAVTVRFPGTKIAPISNICALTHVRLSKTCAKGVISAMISSGKVCIVSPFVAD
ncbi:MAG: hypothetical protein ACE5F6_12665, partial [Anaerolineae bacterium]